MTFWHLQNWEKLVEWIQRKNPVRIGRFQSKKGRGRYQVMISLFAPTVQKRRHSAEPQKASRKELPKPSRTEYEEVLHMKQGNIAYILLRSHDSEAPRHLRSVYSVSVRQNDPDYKEAVFLYDITRKRSDACDLVRMLWRNTVPPYAAEEVLADMLGIVL